MKVSVTLPAFRVCGGNKKATGLCFFAGRHIRLPGLQVRSHYVGPVSEAPPGITSSRGFRQRQFFVIFDSLIAVVQTRVLQADKQPFAAHRRIISAHHYG